MDSFTTIRQIISEIMDIEEQEILPETFVVRDLGAESIDLLELAVSLNAAFQIEIRDDDIFLRKLRLYLDEAAKKHQDRNACLAEQYPFLNGSRIREILNDLDKGPVLKVSDLVSYILYYQRQS